MRIAFIEPYFGGSHRAFAEGYAAASRHDVVLFTHPASFWKWRMQGGFLTLAAEVTESVARDGSFDLVFATSMLDLARFLGATRHVIGDVPVVLYMHENQLTYPTAPRDEFDMTYAMSNWTSMAVADLVLFNSEFHSREWFAALPGLLLSLPDQRHGDFVSEVMERSAVLPVGVDLSRFDRDPRVAGERPLVLWNQRWEHDKGPDLFAAAVIETAASGAHFDLALAGEQFVSDPTGFEDVRAALGDRVVHYGYADDATYVDLLLRADIVVSTARQEFFGIAITEAVYAGALPLVPDSLVYPERIPEEHHATCLYNGADDLVAKLTWAIAHPQEAKKVAQALHPVMAEFDWGLIAPRFDERLEHLVRSR